MASADLEKQSNLKQLGVCSSVAAERIKGKLSTTTPTNNTNKQHQQTTNKQPTTNNEQQTTTYFN